MFRKNGLLIGLSTVIFILCGSGCKAKSEEVVGERPFPVSSEVVSIQLEIQPTDNSILDLQPGDQPTSTPRAASFTPSESSWSQFEVIPTATPRIANSREKLQQERIFPPVEISVETGVSEEPLTPIPTSTPSRQPDPAEFEGFDFYSNFESCENDILAYLNAEGSTYALEDALSAVEEPSWAKEYQNLPKMDRSMVRVVDITGDGIREVVVVLRWEPYFSNVDRDRVLLVFTPESDGFKLIARIHTLDLVWRPYDMELDRIEDINLDGQNEIVLTIADFQGPGGINLLYVTFILRWNGSKLEQLIMVPENAFLQPYSEGAGALNFRPAIMDNDGDRKLEIVVRHHGLYPGGSSRNRFVETGPMRGRTEIWSWDGHQYSLTTELDPPLYRIYLVHDADDAVLGGDYERAMSLYLQVIFDDELHSWGTNFGNTEVIERPDERKRLSAYATYRILLLHLVWGNEAEAQRDLKTLHEYYPEDNPHYPFTEMAAILLETYQSTGDIGAACGEASEYAASAVYSGLDTYWFEWDLLHLLGYFYYGWYNRDYSAVDICPFQ